jgi:glycerophosphoryl diester phosphodiesterase
VTRIAAHRGGAALWPENSLLAFQSAIALGSDLLEFDVHLTRDRAVAVIHDATLERTTDGSGSVASVTAPDLRRLRLRGPDKVFTGEHVPTLDEVLAIATAAPVPVGLLVEVKGPAAGARYDGLEALILAALARAGLQARATIMAFDPHVLARVRELAPRARTTLLVERASLARVGSRPEQVLDWAAAAGVTDLGLDYTLVDEGLVAAAHAANLALGVWTVNDAEAIRRMLDLGVDIITSDRPDLAKRLQRGGRR